MNISRRDAIKLFAGSVPAYYATGALSLAARGANAPAAATAPAAAIGLKDAYTGKFLIGCAGDLPGRYSEAELANIKANYNIVTPENCMKPQGTQPSEGNFSFTTPDALVEWCQQNGIKVWGHTLCWHSQTPQFFFQGTREEGLARLQKHIETVAGHFAGKLLGWDVVNESINDAANEQSENLRNSSWYRLVGNDVLNKAFEWAHKADPKAILYYNDYNIEQHAADNKGKHPSSLLLLKRLLDEGAPIKGVGIQGHWHLDTRIENIEKAILNYKALGLEVAVTELDVTATGTNSGAFNPGGAGGAGGGDRRGTRRGNTEGATPPATGPGAMAPSNARFSLAAFEGAAPGGAPAGGAPGGAGARRGAGGGMGGMGGMGFGRRGGTPMTPEEQAKVFQQQADVYKQIFEIFNRNADVVKRVTFWGISDTRTWRGGQNPLLFDGQLQPKPAFQAVIDVGLGKNAAPKP
ncbi:MAG: endo-1,4-beta-xylanase [Sedimentisphaerales bacterium]|nr:endo-1,4-beta-xylanase [Sedimentisphaerales bacterium]